MAPATAAYRRSVVSCRRHNAALRRDIAAGDGDVMRGNILPAADARAVVAAVGRDRAAGDVDAVGGIDAIHVLRRLPAAAANARAALDAGSDHIAAVNIDLAAPPLIAAADAGGPSAAGGPHSSGVKIQLLPGSSPARADARAALTAVGYDRAAPVVRIALRAEMDVHAMAVHVFVVKTVKNIPGSIAAADAGSLCAALARHRGPGSRQHIQRALAAVLLNGRASGRALQGAVLADEIDICRSLFVQLYGRPQGAGAHFNIYAVNKYVRRGFVSLDEDLLIPCPCVPELIGNGRVDVVAPTVLNGDVRCPVVHINAHVVLWDGIHRSVRRRYCCRQQRQHHAA